MDSEGKCKFDRFKKESKDKIDYIEKELANALKPREEGGKGVLSDICLGYVQEMRREGISDFGGEDLRKKIYHGAMLYMFRLLFLFYADARGLLSDDNHPLLDAGKKLGRDLQTKGSAKVDQYTIWKQFNDIFVDIDQTYNGGLFSPQESEFTRFISETRIADQHLASAVYYLTTYRERNQEIKAISYRDMGVRHLGTLYEGLLEHKLFIAKEDTEVKLSKGKIRFVPVSQGGKLAVGRTINAGQVYFAGDPTERKSIGSYYTPEYIVDYIVSNTVGEKLKALKTDFLEQEKGNYQAFTQAIDKHERDALAALLEENSLRFVRERVLQLSVLDPAMGSGHFLVNAANLISNSITKLMNELGVQGGAKTDTAYWRRWVVENCIYGVDLNPLAVELAKLSLWILSMAKDQPLSFLNHHLKIGNSLIGARLDEVGLFPLSSGKPVVSQLELFKNDPDLKTTVEKAIINTQLIAAKTSNCLEDVLEKRTWLEEIEKILAGYKAICSVHTDIYFKPSIDETQYAEMVGQKRFNFAQSLIEPNQYFHWELEFPEICLGRGGFTCITCNPPYDTFKEEDFFQKSPAAGSGNLFGHFIARTVDLNAVNGSIGFIVPLSFACGSSFENTRKTIYKNYQILESSHYSKRPNMLFDNVQQRITIFNARKKNLVNKCELRSSRLRRWKKEDQEYVVRNPNQVFVDYVSSGVIPKVGDEVGAEIFHLIMKAPLKMGEIFNKKELFGNPAYYHNVAMYWIKAYDFLPYFKRENEKKPSQSTTIKEIFFENQFNRDLFVLLINSSIFYYWWITQCDEFHVLISEIRNFGLHGYDDFKKNHTLINSLVRELMADYEKNSLIKRTALGGSTAHYQEFYPRKSRHIINRIDDFIAPIYGLSEEQNHFLKEYDLIWRTNEEQE